MMAVVGHHHWRGNPRWTEAGVPFFNGPSGSCREEDWWWQHTEDSATATVASQQSRSSFTCALFAMTRTVTPPPGVFLSPSSKAHRKAKTERFHCWLRTAGKLHPPTHLLLSIAKWCHVVYWHPARLSGVDSEFRTGRVELRGRLQKNNTKLKK